MCGAPSLGAADSGHGLPASVRRAPTALGGGMASGPSTGAGLLRPRHTVPVSAVCLGRSGDVTTLDGGAQDSSCRVVLRAMRDGIPNFRLIFVM